MNLSPHRFLPGRPRQRALTPAELASFGPKRGALMIGALMLVSILSLLLAVGLSTAVDTSVTTTRRMDHFGGKSAANSINRLAAQEIWMGYDTSVPAGEDRMILDARSYLDGIGLPNQAGVSEPPRVDYLDRIGLQTDPSGNRILGNSIVLSVVVHRVDEGRATLLHVTTVTDSTRGGEQIREAVTDVFNIGAPLWDGLNFGLLANNVNCLMCHTTADDVRNVYAVTDADEVGGTIRARIGAIESFQMRHDPESTINGTMYLGRDAIDDNGDTITNWSDFSLKASKLDEDGNIEIDRYGNPTLLDLRPTSESNPAEFANLYTNYLSQSEPVDGELPDEFPPPFPDDGGYDMATGAAANVGTDNRVIDDLEFQTTVATFSGSVTGGAIGLARGRVSNSAEAQGLLSGNESELGAVTSGNVVLTGTEDEPIRINGQVAIDGDLIISGPVEGLGSLWVRGNIYVTGDLEYKDAETRRGDRIFGASVTGKSNALGLAAGGNIVMGDPYRGAWGDGVTDGTASGAWNFTTEQTAIFNRGEWLKTQEELPGQPVQVQVGTTTHREEIKVQVTGTSTRNITERRPTGCTVTVPVYERRQTGTRQEPVYERRQTGSREEPVYRNVTKHGGTPYETTERVQTGTRSVPIYEQVQTGTRSVPVYENVQVGTREEPEYETVVVGQESVPTSNWVSQSPPVFREWEEPIYEWQTPYFPNPDYKGPSYIPRFYGFGEGDPIPIPTGDGYFDPGKNRWVAPEMLLEWGADGLTLADPNDPNDPLLNPAGAQPAVIETLEPKADWIGSDVLRGLIQGNLAAREARKPFKVDATLYSANSIFGIVPVDIDAGTRGQLRIQGAVLAADVGLVAPRGTEINYDPRGKDALAIPDETKLGLKSVGMVPARVPMD